MGAAGSEQAAFEKATWPELARLAKEHPECGIAFQSNFFPDGYFLSQQEGLMMMMMMIPRGLPAHP